MVEYLYPLFNEHPHKEVFKILSLFGLLKTAFKRNRIYVFNHMINTLGSFIFGYVYSCVWTALLHDKPPSQVRQMVTYVMVNQASLWVTMFLPYGCFLYEKTREGTISFDLLKPYSLLQLSLFEVGGHCFYNLLFRSLPIFLFSIFLLQIELPVPKILLPYFLSLFLAFLVSFFLNYIVGLWALKFFNISAAQNTYYFLMNLFGGFFLPAEYFPPALRLVISIQPFACSGYIPSSIYLGRLNPVFGITVQAVWVFVLWAVCRIITEKVTKDIRITGG